MLTVSKVLILRATAMKEEYCPADSVKPGSCPCAVACFATLFREVGFVHGVERRSARESPGGADGSVQHHGQLRRLLSLLSRASHPSHGGSRLGWWWRWRWGGGKVAGGSRRSAPGGERRCLLDEPRRSCNTLRRRWSYILQARNDAGEGIHLLEQPAAVAKHLPSAT